MDLQLYLHRGLTPRRTASTVLKRLQRLPMSEVKTIVM